MSFLGTGLGGSMLGTMLGGALDTILSDDDVKKQPIPTFYFAVELMDVESASYKAPEVAKFGGDAAADSGGMMGGLQKMGAGALSAAKGAFAKNNTLSFDPNEDWHEKAFIEVSGIEMGVDTDPKPEGGYNYPLDIPTRMRNPHVTLKRLFRPKNVSDVWSKWIKDTFDAMAYWKTPIKTKIVQITLYHPNLGADSGKPLVLYSVALYDAYPVKQSFGTFNSTSEDLMTEEIELSYSNMQAAYGTVKEASPMGN